MGNLILVTGGARSGKSTFAEGLLRELGDEVLYVATAKAFDQEMQDRIKKHQASRPQGWQTLEAYRELDRALALSGTCMKGIILDCVTIMITNLMMDYEPHWDKVKPLRINEIEGKIMDQFVRVVEYTKNTDATVVLVTNEVGFGIVPGYPMARAFRDIAGRVNQYLASQAHEVYLTVCGLPLKIK